jgi:hypothetical protein
VSEFHNKNRRRHIPRPVYKTPTGKERKRQTGNHHLKRDLWKCKYCGGMYSTTISEGDHLSVVKECRLAAERKIIEESARRSPLSSPREQGS